jgi:regulator of sirC expression with transglutaminase-like and TPR domain
VDLLVRAIEDDDVELAAIAIASDDHRIDIGDVRAQLDALASNVAAQLSTRTGLARLRAFLRHFYRELAFRGPDDYGDPDLHHIDRVLDRRAGSPVVLAVVLIAIGRRVGVEIDPVAFPGHFLVRFSQLLIDPCTGAMPIPQEALSALAMRELELPRSAIDARLERASARGVAIRILENLQEAHRERGDRARSLIVDERLLALGGPAASTQRIALSLVRSIRPKLSASHILVVHRRGLSFRLDDGPLIDLQRRRALPLLLVRLAEHGQQRATDGLGWPALVEAGWPGEKIQADAAWARLRTAIRALRKLGLHDVLITIGSGYLLDPSCDVRWEQ